MTHLHSLLLLQQAAIYDAGSGADVVDITASFGISETASASDSVPIEVPILDNAIGGDQPLGLFIAGDDVGSAGETFDSQASLGMADAGVGAEVPVIWLYFNDQSYRHNVPAGEQNLYDSGTGTEGYLIEVNFNVDDVGSALDVFTAQNTFNVSDSGLAVEATTILLTQFDIGAGADIVASQASFNVNDAGVIYELVSKDFAVLDAGQGEDRFAIRLLQRGRIQYTIRLRVIEPVFDTAAFDPQVYE